MQKEILFVSALSTDRLVNDIYDKTKQNPGFAVQKFSRLLVNGFVENKCIVNTLSVPPFTSKYSRDLWVKVNDEKESGVYYNYIPFINIPLIKHLCILFYSFFYVLRWGMQNKDNKVVICDVLTISASIGSLLASKCCGVKSTALVTDIYDLMVGKDNSGIKNFVKWLAGVLNKLYVRSFSLYVLLTEDMNSLVNPKNRPYVIMEGLCDSDAVSNHEPIDKYNAKVIMYAGGLEERYGVKMLVDAFKLIDNPNVELHLYGSGSYASILIDEIKYDSRIKYFGVRANYEIVQAERRATILVNPRFTNEDFVKYSFPSKNMEYMVSGTPLLTTKLPGMPEEYNPYVFLFEDESLEGYAQSMSNVLSKTDAELNHLGMTARDFVLKKKNNVFQSKRICDFFKTNSSR